MTLEELEEKLAKQINALSQNMVRRFDNVDRRFDNILEELGGMEERLNTDIQIVQRGVNRQAVTLAAYRKRFMDLEREHASLATIVDELSPRE